MGLVMPPGGATGLRPDELRAAVVHLSRSTERGRRWSDGPDAARPGTAPQVACSGLPLLACLSAPGRCRRGVAHLQERSAGTHGTGPRGGVRSRRSHRALRHGHGVSRPLHARVLRLHALPRRLPQRAPGRGRGHQGAGSGGGSRAAGLHHAVSQDDFLVATNFRGHVFGVDYRLWERLGLRAWGLASRPNRTPAGVSNDESVRLRVDLTAKF
jgi:hypothetical protein